LGDFILKIDETILKTQSEATGDSDCTATQCTVCIYALEINNTA